MVTGPPSGAATQSYTEDHPAAPAYSAYSPAYSGP